MDSSAVNGGSILLYSNDLANGNVAAFIELSADGNNVRMGVTKDSSTYNIQTTKYTDWQVNKGETGDQGYGFTSRDVLLYWSRNAASGGVFDYAEVDWTRAIEYNIPP